MSPFGWLLFVLFSVKCVHSRQSLIDILRADVPQEWNEDLEPVLEGFTKRLRRELYPIVQEILVDDEISNECLQSIVRLSSGLNERRLWALRFLDSSGKPAAGTIGGQMNIFGSYDTCLEIRVPDRDDPEKVAFGGQYCTASIVVRRQPLVHKWLPEVLLQDPVFARFLGWNMTGALNLMERIPFGLRIGLCLPSTCDGSIISHLAEKFVGKYGIRADVLACKDQLSDTPAATGTVIAGVVTATLIGCVILGTIVDSFSHENSPGIYALVRCFSARTAYLKVTSNVLSPADQRFDFVHGIRVLSSFWILYSHTFVGDPGNFDGVKNFMVNLRSPLFVLVPQGMLAIETFFTITGIFLYRVLKRERNNYTMGDPGFALLFIFRRAIRLLIPALGAICMFYLFPLMTSGPGFDAAYPFFRENCDERWWTIPLFINNLWTFEYACVGNQWYNAVDMQLLCVLILPTLFMLRRPSQGLLLISVFIVGSMIYTVGLSIHHDALPLALLLPKQYMRVLQFGLKVHVHFITHLPPFGVGLIGGYCIENHKDARLSKLFLRIGWCLYCLLALFILFVAHVWHERGSISMVESVVYGGLYRALWASFIIWIVFMCSSGRAQPIRWFLSRPIFITLGRLSYCFYLIQLQVVMMKNLSARQLVPFSYYQIFRDFFADLIFNYLGAWVLLILYEAPTMALDKLAFSRSKKEDQADTDKKANHVNEMKSERLSTIHYKL